MMNSKTSKTLKSLILYTHTHTHTHTSKGCIENFYFKEPESGRSMVEMLGTLAIIGVLSVVGLAIYGVAMTSLRANNILNEVNKRAYACVTQISMMGYNQCMVTDYPDKIDDKYPVFAKQHNNTGNVFEIHVADVPGDLCRQIKNKGIPSAGKIEPENCVDTNEMIFVFNVDLDGMECKQNEECTVCGSCQGGLCSNVCDIPEATCTKDSDCNQTNQCMACNTETGQCEYKCIQKEWLESAVSGQYIDTGIKVYDSVMRAELSFANPAHYFFGAGRTCCKGKGVAFGVHDNQWSTIKPGNDYNVFGTATQNRVNFTWEISGNTSKVTGYANNTVTSADHFGTGAAWRNDFFITLFSLPLGTPSKARFYSLKIYKDDDLVRDFIPVIAPDGKPCMFDKVSQHLFRNQGSGEFLTN